MSNEQFASDQTKIPVLLLKTKSTPTDAYEEQFSKPHGSIHFEPHFVPVLHHIFQDEGMKQVEGLLREGKINNGPDCAYGGIIFTSQRAVEAFAKLVEDGKGDATWPHLQGIPIYSVGPATTRALKAIPQDPPLHIFGEQTGNGEALAHFILEHYCEWYKDKSALPPLLFLVGEQRRDIIPKTLTDESLPPERRIPVTEVVVYGTGVMESFADDFKNLLKETRSRQAAWVVVFSPTGCDHMLEGLGLLGDDGRAKQLLGHEARREFVATIGPTTSDFLRNKFGFTPNVCAGKPSPEGVWGSITHYMSI